MISGKKYKEWMTDPKWNQVGEVNNKTRFGTRAKVSVGSEENVIINARLPRKGGITEIRSFIKTCFNSFGEIGIIIAFDP